MRAVTLAYGAVLIVLGLVAYFGLGRESVTALIPAFFGVPVVVLGLLAGRESLYRHMMHAAAALGLLGLLGTASGLVKGVRALTGAEVDRPGAVAVQAIMAVLSAVFVAACVASFIRARRAQSGS
jgi:uncharacterized membrane protein